MASRSIANTLRAGVARQNSTARLCAARRAGHGGAVCGSNQRRWRAKQRAKACRVMAALSRGAGIGASRQHDAMHIYIFAQRHGAAARAALHGSSCGCMAAHVNGASTLRVASCVTKNIGISSRGMARNQQQIAQHVAWHRRRHRVARHRNRRRSAQAPASCCELNNINRHQHSGARPAMVRHGAAWRCDGVEVSHRRHRGSRHQKSAV